MGEPILTICMHFMMFLPKELFLGVALIAPALTVKVFSSVNFLKLRLIPESVNGLI